MPDRSHGATTAGACLGEADDAPHPRLFDGAAAVSRSTPIADDNEVSQSVLMNADVCPICLNAHGATAQQTRSWNARDENAMECTVCGRFALTSDAFDDFLNPREPGSRPFTPIVRARLSYRVRSTAERSPGRNARLDSAALQRFLDDGAPGPTPAEQARNIIRLIGDAVNESGLPLDRPPGHFYAAIGAPNPHFAGEVLAELHARGLVTGILSGTNTRPLTVLQAGLSLAGWKEYEDERRGRTAGTYGFIALQFGDPILDGLVASVMKPAAADLGFDLFDMRDVKEAGVIDNLIRMRIRDAAFVLADLSHGNNGAYWEAGFAEGLGKPVIYLCEKAQFDSARTHFDTNHCTTVMWDAATPSDFQADLVATLRNSLKLFAAT